jgi:signal transduction histidine kinase/CheY-like chemotaxis protein
MLKSKSLPRIVSILPLIILLVMSSFFLYQIWGQYQSSKALSNTLENAKLLQQYEKSILNETLCGVLDHKALKLLSTKCKDSIGKSQKLFNQISKRDAQLLNWQEKIDIFRKNSNKFKVDDFEKIVGRKNLASVVKSYLESIEHESGDIQEKELLQLYAQISDNIYATELENFLVTYYVSTKHTISASNMIFWDKIVEVSSFFELEDTKHIPLIVNDIEKLVHSDTFHKNMSKIDDIRIAILTKGVGKDPREVEWGLVLEKKLDILTTMQNLVYTYLHEHIANKIQHFIYILLAYLVVFVLSLISLLYVYWKIGKEKTEDKTLSIFVKKIHALSQDIGKDSIRMQKMLDNIKNKEDAFTYVYSNFQLLQEKTKEAMEVAETKSQYLATLSHEIRTPLSSIVGFSKVLRDMGVSVDQEEYLALIESSSNNLIAIVNDILDLSKIDAEKMEIENVSFNIFETVEYVVSTFAPQADQKDIELGVFVDPFLPDYFLGDPTKLSQILTNLIGNAIKFTNTYGKVNIFVQCTYDNDDTTQIKFAVNDNGIGFSDDERKNIFNAFSQANKSTSSTYGGTGLGLTISRQMVALMGGTLEVESKPGAGSSFYFTITLKKDLSVDEKVAPDFSDVSVGLALPIKGIDRQLDTNLEVYMKYLGANFSIHYYDDLFEGLGFMNLPDIMIFDHRYARLAGELEQSLSLDCKIVLLTNGTLRSRINTDKHKFDDILLRPIGLRKCIRILRTAREKNENLLPEITTHIDSVEFFAGLSALVADDNNVNRKLIKIMLEKLGLHVTLTVDGSESFEAYKNGQYDIIFMDIQMPVCDGVEATHKILEYEKEKKIKHIPIIALTANASAGDKEKYLSEGMDDYLTKPIEVEKLKELIEKYTVGLFASVNEK